MYRYKQIEKEVNKKFSEMLSQWFYIFVLIIMAFLLGELVKGVKGIF